MNNQTPSNLLFTRGVPITGAGLGGYYGGRVVGPVGFGAGALLGILAAELIDRARNRTFIDKLVSLLAGESDSNQQLGMLVGASLGGGLGTLAGNIGGAYIGHDIGERLVGG